FSLAAIDESQRRLSTLGLFRRARITELGQGNGTTRDLLVTIEEAPPTTIGYGGGLERRLRTRPTGQQQGGRVATEQFEIAPRATFEIGRRNLFGKDRSVNLYTSISLQPSDTVTQYRVTATYREPRVLNTQADAFVNLTTEQQIRSSFTFRRSSASAQVARRLTRSLSVT